MNVTVYLGSREGSDPALNRAARELGAWIGGNGHRLIYGGSKCGLMGVLAESVLAAGGEVIGIEPRFFVEEGLVYDDITQLIITEDMSQRKTKMMEMGDAFIAFPGGTGTLEEISEVLCRMAMGKLDKPCVLYNLNGYYEGLRQLLLHMEEMGLSSLLQEKEVCFAEGLEDIKRAVAR